MVVSAVAGVETVMSRVVVMLRLSSTLAAATAAVVGLAPPAQPAWVLGCLAALLPWSAIFAAHVLRRGPSTLWSVADASVAVLLCLFRDRLLPAEALAASAGTGWVDILASSGVFIAQFGMRQPGGALCGFAIAGGYVVGRDGFAEAGVVLVVQVVIAAAIATLLRRAAASSDAVLAEEAAVRGEAVSRAAVRADEREQQRQLHDTVLATLTMVNTGTVSGDSAALHQRVAADLAVVDDLRARPRTRADADAGTTRLDLALARVASQARPDLPALDVTLEVLPVEMAADVVRSMAAAVAEALTNVARHSGVMSVTVTACVPGGGGVEVRVCDSGVGFDPAAVPHVRRGLRESVIARLSAVGGAARIESAPGAGATVVLTWPDG